MWRHAYRWGGEGTPLPEGLIYQGVSSMPRKVNFTMLVYAIPAEKALQYWYRKTRKSRNRDIILI